MYRLGRRDPVPPCGQNAGLEPAKVYAAGAIARPRDDDTPRDQAFDNHVAVANVNLRSRVAGTALRDRRRKGERLDNRERVD